ncbi:MAG: penicillin-binding transpeptidase domain-containing protein, partial [Coprococcus sp.]
ELPIKMNKQGEMEFTISGSTLNTFLINVYGVSSVDLLKDEEKNATARQVFDYMRGPDLFNISEIYSDEYALKILSVRYEIWLNRFQQYMSVVIASDVSEESYAAIMENSDELLGMNVNVESIRVYNDAVYFSHIIGYIGNISTEELEEYNNNLDKDSQYNSNDMVGKMGLEKQFESELRGMDGYQKMYVDNMGKVLEVIESNDSRAGNDIYLTIDSDLQKYCYNALERELANIILSHMVNTTSSTDYEDITIIDIYNSLFDNNIISISQLNDAAATENEKQVYNTFLNAKKYTLSQLDDILNVSHTPLYQLSAEYQDYMEFICETLSKNNIYDTSVLDKDNDATYKAYIANEISLCEFLKYAISKGAINLDSISTESDYYDTDEIYDVVTAYILEEFEKDTSFDKHVFKYMLLSGEITGAQVINLLFDQGVLNTATDEDYEEFSAGVISNYEFMYRKIKKLEITPAMMALDPCSGSIVVTDPDTGDVKALVVYPGYDNNRLTNEIDEEYYKKVTEDKTTPMYNRATMQRTAPGSTFKPLSTVAGLSENVISLGSVIQTTGSFDKITPSPHCWIYPGSHGTIGIASAIENSCNCFFYEVGYRLATDGNGEYNDKQGIDKLKKYASLFGFDAVSGIELPELEPQISDNDIVRSSIGQGTNNYTPVQLAKYVTTIANEGTCYDLSIINQIKDIDGNIVKSGENSIHSTVELSDSEWNTIKQGMRQVVSNHTASTALINQINVNVAGKTGTAQEDKTRPDHGLFISFAPYEDPEVSVTCVIPHGYSSGNAEELAAMVYAYMYDPEALNTTEITGNNQVSD